MPVVGGQANRSSDRRLEDSAFVEYPIGDPLGPGCGQDVGFELSERMCQLPYLRTQTWVFKTLSLYPGAA